MNDAGIGKMGEIRPLAVVFAVILSVVALAACSEGVSVEGAAKELVESLAARDAAKVAEIMDTSEQEAERNITVSFAGRAQQIRDVTVSPNDPGCEQLSAKQLASGLSELCHVIADLQFRETADGEWRDLRLAFVVEICRERAIVSIDSAAYVPAC